MARRNFKRLDADDFLLIYKTYVRPHGILYSSVVISSSEGHTNSGMCSKNSHQNGIQVKEITVRVKITQTWTNNAREKNQGGVLLRHLQV